MKTHEPVGASPTRGKRSFRRRLRGFKSPTPFLAFIFPLLFACSLFGFLTVLQFEPWKETLQTQEMQEIRATMEKENRPPQPDVRESHKHKIKSDSRFEPFTSRKGGWKANKCKMLYGWQRSYLISSTFKLNWSCYRNASTLFAQFLPLQKTLLTCIHFLMIPNHKHGCLTPAVNTVKFNDLHYSSCFLSPGHPRRDCVNTFTCTQRSSQTKNQQSTDFVCNQTVTRCGLFAEQNKHVTQLHGWTLREISDTLLKILIVKWSWNMLLMSLLNNPLWILMFRWLTLMQTAQYI